MSNIMSNIMSDIICDLTEMEKLCGTIKYRLTLAEKQAINETQIRVLENNFNELKILTEKILFGFVLDRIKIK